jgi:uncharacterized protein
MAMVWRLSVVASCFAVTLAACSTAPADPQAAYVPTLLAERAQKDEAFRRQVDQPIAADKQAEFLPLRYFPPDQSYVVNATFTPAPTRTPVRVPTSTGQMRDMELVGTLEFTLKGRPMSLQSFAEADQPPDKLWVPFSDFTSGTETYPGGRYMEIPRSAAGIYVVDFNRAFHPYCYYNHTYDCPYPPPRNRLPVPVRAGEKLAQSNVPAAGR